MAIAFTHKPGLVAYITCGDPDLPTTKEVVLAAVRSGADVIELGVPFSDPVADGPVIQRACDRALRRGTTLENVLQLAREVRAQTDAGLIVFSYLNPLLKFGLARFCAAAEAAGIDGALVTDLPVEEAGEYLRVMRSRSLATVFLAAPTSTDERLRRIAEVSTGFLYAVSRTGVTGVRTEFPADSRELVARVRRFTPLPIAVGFGISTPGQFAAVGQYAEAAVVGSALMQAIENSPDTPAEAVAELIITLRSQVGKRQGSSNKQ
jgi:tryptophan synthase alpha chain